jgi:hypothetical protein
MAGMPWRDGVRLGMLMFMKYLSLHPNTKDLAGRRFGRLLALGAASAGPVCWHCVCDCGKECIVEARCLSQGATRSCGCLAAEHNRKNGLRSRKHGRSLSSVYRVWHQMVRRCTNPRTHNWARYGGRGITVCERWKEFSAFIADMGECPPGHSLERINNEGSYSPENCRWATPKEQSSNMRTNRRITAFGETLHVSEWSRRLGIRGTTIHGRLKTGLDGEAALTRPRKRHARVKTRNAH